jgi:hypothetical protein
MQTTDKGTKMLDILINQRIKMSVRKLIKQLDTEQMISFLLSS